MSRKAILIVSGDQGFRSRLGAELRNAGIQVREAADGKSALQVLTASEPGLILAASVLPDMSGGEFCRRVRAVHPLTAGLSVAVAVDLARPGDVTAALSLGADYVFAAGKDMQALARDVSAFMADPHAGGGEPWLARPELAARVLRDFYLKALAQVPVLAETAPERGKPAPGAPASPPAPSVRADGPGKGLRVLLAEDNMVNRLLAERMLVRSGCTVVSVDNGAKALTALAAERFDLIMMDVQMPEMSGLEATQRIRASRDGRFDPKIPIVAMTAQAYEMDREQCLAAGMTDFLEKPINYEKMEQLLRLARAGKTPAAAPEAPPAEHAPGEEPDANILDLHQLQTRYQGNTALLQEIYAIYKNDSPQRLAKIKEGVRTGDMDMALRSVHSLSGASAAIGAKRASAVAREMENALRSGDFTVFGQLCPNLEEEVQKVIRLIG